MTLFQVFIFLFLVEFTYQDSLDDDLQRCSSSERTQCKSIQISDKNFECCEAFVDYYKNTYDFYTFQLQLTKKAKESNQEKREYLKIVRESQGFSNSIIESSKDYDYNFSYTIIALLKHLQ